jgi:hypothetical protein
MWRQCTLAVAVALGSMPGCGMAVRKLDQETLAAATTAHRSFSEPSHRVALAVFEAMRAELATAEFASNSEFSADPGLVKRDGSPVKEGELPAEYPGFWLEWKANDGRASRSMVTLKAAHFAGKTLDGRPVEVDVEGQGGETVVSTRVAKLGDRMFSIWLMEKVTNRLNHPANPPGSLEEAATFKAFFGGVESREALPTLHKRS